ncbi:ITP binding [Mactra antiquata]
MAESCTESSRTSIWGMLEDSEQYGRHGDSKNDYKVIDYQSSKNNSENMHGSHGMIYAEDDKVLWDLYPNRGAILMQMRFDGILGFPGGLVDPGEDPVLGLNREMHEEIGLDLEKFSFTDENHVITFLNEEKKLILHFYIKQVNIDELKSIEMASMQAVEHGIEALGCIRPPLYTMGDNLRGLPLFLCNQFAGNAREELLIGLYNTKLLTREEIDTALKLAEQFKSKV